MNGEPIGARHYRPLAKKLLDQGRDPDAAQARTYVRGPAPAPKVAQSA